ncbi:MAG: 5-amino-6-(D-ribitylamino)uracil--L-tyrosine 4-hydroxyphenyl transferase CofH [Pseudorhodoplanes sp.]
MSLPLDILLRDARGTMRAGHGERISYSRKVFIPLTRLCRDVCSYCTFATSPRQVGSAYLSPEEVLVIARAGEDAGCREALFTLGDKPELRYPAARAALRTLGFASTADYLAFTCELVLRETSLLPHVNAGVMSDDEMIALRRVSVSQGIMLETAAERLSLHGGPHYGSPDKLPAVRLANIEAAGRLAIAFSSGILIGIGETRPERLDALFALRALHRRFGHLQEIIVQNFRAKTDTRMAQAPEPDLDDLLWTAAAARLVFGPQMNIQVPPNLSFGEFPRLLSAGINDWGGISPVTPDHVNPEAPWPHLDRLDQATREAGFALVERLAIYPQHALAPQLWLDRSLRAKVSGTIDSSGLVRDDRWFVGLSESPPPAIAGRPSRPTLDAVLAQAQAGERLDARAIVGLFAARGDAADEICAAADDLRARVNGDTASYVVNRNINYTNVCQYACRFCAFSKGRGHEALRGSPYDLSLDEVARRVAEAWDRGATEVCMQGGIHPSYDGNTYLELVRVAKDAAPYIHVHAFSPLEVAHGASTLGLSMHAFLERLKAAGLGSLPGTAAEILDDAVRRDLCPDKLDTTQWLEVIAAAHAVGLRTTATIMFGHIETTASWAAHLLHVRDLQERTGGFTEFVPLPFVHMEAPMHLKGLSRKGPTWRETRLMHAVARLVLHPLIGNIQASWVKLGPQGVAHLLSCGVNDLGGTLMNESISRSAGTQHGQEFPPEAMEVLIRAATRQPRQRTTLYRDAGEDARRRSFAAPALAALVQTPLRRRTVEANLH